MSITEQIQPVSPAFARRARSAGLLVLLFTTTLFAVFSRGLLTDVRNDNLRSTARLLSATLPRGSQQRYKEAVIRTVGEHDALLAVATLDAFGSVSSIYPDRPQHRSSLDKLLKANGEPTRITSPVDGTSCVLTAIAVAFGDRFSPKNAILVAIMRVDSPVKQWLTSISIFTILVAVVALYATGTLCRWIDRQILSPLRRMADIVGDPGCDAKILRSGHFSRWRETARLAQHFQDLQASLDQSNVRATRFRKDAQRTMRDREVGFDKRLRRAHFLAQTDPLTQLRNRAFLDNHLDSLFEKQTGLNRELSAVMLDLDDFKDFNDALGHQVGDALLKFTGALLRGSIRPADYAIRYGGDEFLLLLPDTDARQATDIADRLIKMFAQHTKSLEQGNMVSMSAGVASIPESRYQNAQELIAAADRALYFAKRAGKNKVEVVSETQTPTS